jgi:hypothetical protein
MRMEQDINFEMELNGYRMHIVNCSFHSGLFLCIAAFVGAASTCLEVCIILHVTFIIFLGSGGFGGVVHGLLKLYGLLKQRACNTQLLPSHSLVSEAGKENVLSNAGMDLNSTLH